MVNKELPKTKLFIVGDGPLKKELEKEGYNFKSSTDSEVAAALIDKLYKENKMELWKSNNCRGIDIFDDRVCTSCICRKNW